ncbi:D-glycero-D-manno-heptose 1-phosphate guanosyltransferase, partial [Campylobacter jejuni]
KFSFEEFLQENYKKLKAKAHIFDDYFIDIGVPEDYYNFMYKGNIDGFFTSSK